MAGPQAGASRGGVAVIILQAIMAGQEYPPEGVPDTPANRALWAETARAVDELPPGVTPEIPPDWAVLPGAERPPPRKRTAGG